VGSIPQERGLKARSKRLDHRHRSGFQPSESGMPKSPRAIALGWYGGAPLVLNTFPGSWRFPQMVSVGLHRGKKSLRLHSPQPLLCPPSLSKLRRDTSLEGPAGEVGEGWGVALTNRLIIEPTKLNPPRHAGLGQGPFLYQPGPTALDWKKTAKTRAESPSYRRAEPRAGLQPLRIGRIHIS
jgi:hypothetical protein